MKRYKVYYKSTYTEEGNEESRSMIIEAEDFSELWIEINDKYLRYSEMLTIYKIEVV